MNLLLPEPLSVHVSRYGFFEEELTRIMLRYVQPGMVVFDVGAHFGYFSLLAAHLVGSNGQVHSFEPTVSTFEVLQSNVATRANVTINNLAVYRENTTLTFKDFGASNSMFNSAFAARTEQSEREKLPEPRTVQVQAVSLDGYAAQHAVVPDFVKIDAESAEPDVLAGMQGLISKHHPMITLEVGDWDVAGAIPSAEVVRMLVGNGYAAMEAAAGDMVPHRVKERYQYDNLLFVPA